MCMCMCVYVYPIAGYGAVTDGYVSHGMVLKSMCVRVCVMFACVRVYMRVCLHVSMSECLVCLPACRVWSDGGCVS